MAWCQSWLGPVRVTAPTLALRGASSPQRMDWDVLVVLIPQHHLALRRRARLRLRLYFRRATPPFHSQASHLLIKLTPVALHARALKCIAAKSRRFPHRKHAHAHRCHFEAERLTPDLLHTSVSRGGLGLFITCSQLVKSCTAEGLSSRL